VMLVYQDSLVLLENLEKEVEEEIQDSRVK